jgi:hypothetical protein
MPSNTRDPNAGASGTPGGAISRNFAFLIIGAVLLLALLRHFFGSIRVEAGVK